MNDIRIVVYKYIIVCSYLGPYAGGQIPQISAGVLVSTATKQSQQTSELRAALAQPSKLQQQEQLLQLQQSQPRGVAAPRVQPPADQLQTIGQHRLPGVNIHDRMPQTMRGAEPKIGKDPRPSHVAEPRLPVPHVEGLPSHLPAGQIYQGL